MATMVMHAGHTDRSVADGASRASAGFATVVFLGIVAGTQMSDRGLQSVLLGGIEATFRVGDEAVGALQGLAGVLVGSALAVPFAHLSDRMSRKHILLALIAVWGVLTAIGALAPNFPLFFVGRAASGVTEFAMIPVVYSLIPDLVAERARVTANLVFAALMAIGASLGFYFGGELVALVSGAGWPAALGSLEPWRRALLALSCAAVPLFGLGLLVKEPARRHAAGDVGVQVSVIAFVRDRWRTIVPFVATAGGLAVAVQALGPMIVLALTRRFASGGDAVGHAMGVVTLATSLGCLPVAGLVDRALAARFGPRARPLVMAVMAALAAPVVAMLALAASVGDAIALVAAFLFLTCTANALIPTMLQDLVPPSLRARGFAVYSFVIACFCAIGPVLSGSLSDRLLRGDLLTAIGVAAAPALLVATAAALLAMRNARVRPGSPLSW